MPGTSQPPHECRLTPTPRSRPLWEAYDPHRWQTNTRRKSRAGSDGTHGATARVPATCDDGGAAEWARPRFEVPRRHAARDLKQRAVGGSV